eukprot:CAMPEP_0119121406 /NCGR_PEP_ID=MMETSP1310-20130426/2055_1 /TAXON_ID=464262 /ORGANISM="Genus nov. species nov., Strain RCC2339" /LENGTH=217 /DNA_ID=CAMNT_0007110969 /DNA_START=49 /DNA_END=699 /DNA_ORIENTATION=-
MLRYCDGTVLRAVTAAVFLVFGVAGVKFFAPELSTTEDEHFERFGTVMTPRGLVSVGVLRLENSLARDMPAEYEMLPVPDHVRRPRFDPGKCVKHCCVHLNSTTEEQVTVVHTASNYGEYHANVTSGSKYKGYCVAIQYNWVNDLYGLCGVLVEDSSYAVCNAVEASYHCPGLEINGYWGSVYSLNSSTCESDWGTIDPPIGFPYNAFSCWYSGYGG